jgi:hypothetical protein
MHDYLIVCLDCYEAEPGPTGYCPECLPHRIDDVKEKLRKRPQFKAFLEERLRYLESVRDRHETTDPEPGPDTSLFSRRRDCA